MIAASYDKYKLTAKEARDCIIISYIALFFGAYLFYHSIIISAAAGVFIPICMKYYAGMLAEKRKDLLTVQFRDFLYSLSASFAAGRHMRDGLVEAKGNLSLMYGESTPMLVEISDMLNKIDGSRAPVEEVFKDFADRSGVADIQSFFDTYFICRMTGGDLNRVISRTSAMLIDKIGIEKEIRTLVSQKCFEGKIISLMPIIVILFLNLVSPVYIEPLYTTVMGRLIMTAALGGIAYAYYLTSKLTEIEV
ncbi:MAG: hypothetical protein FWG42_08525 [Clostridiales bacterium]|nr:hypothetical protein [Clostridiales bacterium]